MVKSSDALLKKPEVIGHQVQGHDPRSKNQNRQGNLETPCNVRDVMTIEGMVGDNRLKMVCSFSLVHRIDHIDGQALIESETNREGQDELEKGPIV